MKSAIIIGASGAIGLSIVEKLASEGWSLYLHGSSHYNKVAKEAERLSTLYPKQDFIALSLDLTSEKHIDTFISGLFSVDAIIFAQGYTHRALFYDMTSEEMDKMWNVHVKVPLLLIQRLQSKLTSSNRGRIVFISSVYGKSGSPMEVFYSMTKGAIEAFVRAYSKETAPSGLTVNAIAPGAIDTPMNQFLDIDEKQSLLEAIPVGRIGQPSEVAFWVAQLLKEEAGYMTGQTITVSGGWMD